VKRDRRNCTDQKKRLPVSGTLPSGNLLQSQLQENRKTMEETGKTQELPIRRIGEFEKGGTLHP